VLAQVWRGGARQANLVRFLALCEIEDLTREHAESVGVLAARAGHGDIVDVTVVEGAIRRGDAVVTSDRAHLEAIAASAGTRLRIAVV
jgi:predicted nucleic acid-binding protein